VIWQRHIPWKAILAATVLAGLAARLAWLASHTETGWETIAADWHAATIGRIVGYRLPVAQRDQRGQNDFWLPEIDRILAREQKTPELFIGAIRFLDTYNGDSQQIFLPELMAVPDIDLFDGPRYHAPESGPERRRAKQRALAAEACREFPSSPSVWQIRAEENYQFDPSSDLSATEWQKIDAECASHDADNALYPLLAANRLLSEATNIANSDDIAASNENPRSEEVLRQHQQKEVELEGTAIKLINEALELPRFELVHDRQPALEFIDKASLPRREKAHLGAWFDVVNYSPAETARLLDLVVERVESRSPGADTTQLRRLGLAVAELYAKQPAQGALWRWRWGVARIRADQWKSWLDFLGRDSTRPPAELNDVRQKAIDLEVDSRRWMSAVQRWARTVPTPYFNTWVGFIAWKSAGLAVSLLLIAGAAWLVWRMLRLTAPKEPPAETVRLGILRQFAAWFVAAAISITLLGLAPAEIISHAVQSWIVVIVFLAVMIAIPVVTAIALGGQISLRTLLALVFVYAFVFGVLFYWDAIDVDRPLHKFPPALWVPARGVQGTSALALQGMMRGSARMYSPSPLRWPALQWIFYHGSEWTVGLALVAVGLWWLVRGNRKWKQSDDSNQRSSRRYLWLTAGVLRAIAGSATWAAVIALAVYLALAPERIEPIEAFYQYEWVQALHPDEATADIEKNYDEVAADQQNTQALRQQVEHDFSQPPDAQ
jgi:hypothetical protein